MQDLGLTFIYAPVRELAPTVAFYRDTLGWEEAWREGDDTVAFRVPGSEVQVMVSVENGTGGAGAMYRVPDLEAFLAEQPDLTVVSPLADIPGGHVAGVDDGSGNPVYFFDFAE